MPLPPEIWSTILDLLPRTGARACLAVDHLLHDIARRRLFSTIHVAFGDRDAHDVLSRGASSPDQYWLDRETEAATRSCDILEHVLRCPAFARVVRKVTVYAYARSAAVFERRLLIRALEALPHLTTLQWNGDTPSLSGNVIDVLSTACHTLNQLIIQEYEVSANQWLAALPERHFDTITGLSGLVFSPRIIDYYEATSHAIQVVDANAQTLRSLGMDDHFALALPIRTFGMLTELILFGQDTMEVDVSPSLPLVLRHAPHLESFAFPYHRLDVFTALRGDASVLPRLRSLALTWHGFTTGDEDELEVREELEALADFLRARTALRRLLVEFGYGEWATLRAFLEAVSTFAALEVLGLHLPSYVTRHEEIFSVLAGVLSDRLFAFSLLLTWDPSSLNADDILPMTTRLARLPRLTFLHIGLSRETTYHFPPEDLAHENPHLCILALGELHIWDIDRRYLYDEPGEPRRVEVTVDKWDRSRVDTRAREDFGPGGEDYEWVLRTIVCHTPGE